MIPVLKPLSLGPLFHASAKDFRTGMEKAGKSTLHTLMQMQKPLLLPENIQCSPTWSATVLLRSKALCAPNTF